VPASEIVTTGRRQIARGAAEVAAWIEPDKDGRGAEDSRGAESGHSPDGSEPDPTGAEK